MNPEVEIINRLSSLLANRLIKFDFEVNQSPEETHMAADAMYCFPASQTDAFNVEDDILAYSAANIYVISKHITG